MNITAMFRHLLLACFLFTASSTQALKTDPSAEVLHEIDVEVFSLMRSELIHTRKVLVEIRDSQNPGLISATASALGTIFKELGYLAGATTLGGGPILIGLALILGPDNVKEMLRNPFGQGAALIALPVLAGSITITYVVLKLIFGRLLAKSTDKNSNIKDSLMLINQTIDKLTYEIKKIERLNQLSA